MVFRFLYFPYLIITQTIFEPNQKLDNTIFIIVSRLMIKKLPESVINQIAAGQVIQRPANVIKELVQNSIDAGATQINIQISNGGMGMIKILDNGVGISVQDYPLLCVRFATSKIKDFQDLKMIGSFGFRGQALASLSYVSHLSVTSRVRQDKLGYQATFKDEKIQSGPSQISHNIGTKICAKDLFFNITNRRASLNPSEQKKRIIKLLSHFCLHYPRIKFALQSEKGDECLPSSRSSLSSANSIGQAKMQIFQQITKLSFDKFSYIPRSGLSSSAQTSQQCEIECILSKLNSCKGKTILLNINNRIIENIEISKAIDNAYSLCYQSVHQDVQNYYVYFSLSIDSRKIDCNVHPTKKNVGLFGGSQFYEVIKNFILEKIKQQSAIKVILKGDAFSNNAKIFDAFKKKADFSGLSQFSQQSQNPQNQQIQQNFSKPKISLKVPGVSSKSSTGTVYAFQKNRTDSKQLPLNYFLKKSQPQKEEYKQQKGNSLKTLKIDFIETQYLDKNTQVKVLFQKITYVGCYGFNYILVHYENRLYMMNITPFIPIFIQNRVKQQSLLIKQIQRPLQLKQILERFISKTKILPNSSDVYGWISANYKDIEQRYGLQFIKSDAHNILQEDQILISHYPCLDQIFKLCSWKGLETSIAYLLCRIYYSESVKQHSQQKFEKFIQKFLQSQFIQENEDIKNFNNGQQQNADNFSPFNDLISAYFKDHVIPVLKIKAGVLNREKKAEERNKQSVKYYIDNYMKEMLDLKDVYKIFQRC